MNETNSTEEMKPAGSSGHKTNQDAWPQVGKLHNHHRQTAAAPYSHVNLTNNLEQIDQITMSGLPMIPMRRKMKTKWLCRIKIGLFSHWLAMARLDSRPKLSIGSTKTLLFTASIDLFAFLKRLLSTDVLPHCLYECDLDFC